LYNRITTNKLKEKRKKKNGGIQFLLKEGGKDIRILKFITISKMPQNFS